MVLTGSILEGSCDEVPTIYSLMIDLKFTIRRVFAREFLKLGLILDLIYFLCDLNE